MKLKKFTIILPVALVLSLATILPVKAHESMDDESSTEMHASSSVHKTDRVSTDSNANESRSSDRNKTETETETEDSEMHADMHHSGDRLKARSLVLLAEAKKGKKEIKTAAQRQKVCEAHKVGIETKTTKMIEKSQKHQARIDEVYTKVVMYKTTNNLTVANWDALIAAADTAKANSAAAVTQLVSSKPQIDCTSQETANQLTTFKAALEQSRQDTKTYRTAVKNLLVAVKTQSPKETAQ